MKRVNRIKRWLWCALLAAPMAAGATSATRGDFGTMPDGRKVAEVTLDNGHGMVAQVITLGAAVRSLTAPDRDGKSANIVLGSIDLAEYLAKPQCFGATVGRYANRIAGGRFTLDGHTYQLPLNDGPNSLHSGPIGFDKVLWTVADVKHDADGASVTLRYVSPDGDMGFPGKLTATATYKLGVDDRLTIDYSATTDKPTIVNITNHIYWNLAGEDSGSVLGQRLTIPADTYLPVDAGAIPTGTFADVTGTAFDFRQGKPIGQDIRRGGEPQLLIAHGYDHNWVISRHPDNKLRLMARAEDPVSGRVLTLHSTQPGLQFYSANHLDGTSTGTSGTLYRQSAGFALEPELFPDTPNQPAFGSARLMPGQTYRNHIVYAFSTDAAAPSR
jgi:aldose 1-epimerase